MNSTAKNRKKIMFITQFAILLAFEAIVCFTPLGSIPIAPPVVATLGMIPVIITAILLGTGAGTLMGFFAGTFSFVIWTFMPPEPVMGIIFTPFYSFGEYSGNMWSLAICFIPRILVGTVAGALHQLFSRLAAKNGNKILLFCAYGIAAMLGSLTNTVLVLGGMQVFFTDTFAKINDTAASVIVGIIWTSALTNGLPEAAVSLIVGYAVCYPIKKILLKQKML